MQRAIADAKNGTIQADVFANEWGAYRGDGPPLPKLPNGCEYLEYDAGGDRLGGRGAHRLVFEVQNGGRIMEIYYTQAHYEKLTFFRLV